MGWLFRFSILGILGCCGGSLVLQVVSPSCSGAGGLRDQTPFHFIMVIKGGRCLALLARLRPPLGSRSSESVLRAEGNGSFSLIQLFFLNSIRVVQKVFLTFD